MNKIGLSILFLAGFLAAANAQEISNSKLAQRNYEEYFRQLKAAYPADEYEYTFSDYSELDSLFAIPEELRVYSEMEKFSDPNTYFSLVENFGQYTPDFIGVIDLSKLNIPLEVKSKYETIKMAISERDKQINKNEIKLIAKYSKELAALLANMKAPFIGFVQTVQYQSVSKGGDVIEGKIYIQYNIELKVVSSG